jgi:glycerophosphoryl diester phosphodiesterase
LNVLAEYDPGARLVIGHRGAAARFPENTFAAFDYAVGIGVDAIEFDIRITGDGVVVVIHDPTLDRTTGSSGRVASLSATELAQADAGARFSPDGGRTFPFAGKGIRVPTLESLIERYPGIPLLIEIKVPEAASETLRIFRRHGCEDRVLIDSMDVRALRLFRGTKVSVGAARRDVVSLYWRTAVGLVPRSLPYRALCIPERYVIDVPVSRLTRAAASCRVPTHVWTVNEPEDARRLWSGGVIGIVSDDPATMLALRTEMSLAAK